MQQLKDIKDMYIIECLIFGIIDKQAIQNKLPSTFFQALGTWIINGKYIPIEEKKEEQATIDATMLNERKKGFITNFCDVPKTLATEKKKLKYLIEDLEYKCELDWSKLSM